MRPDLVISLGPAGPATIRLEAGPTVELEAGERHAAISIRRDPAGDFREIGLLKLPAGVVPHLGRLGILCGLGVIGELRIVGEGAPEVVTIGSREIRLLQIAAKLLV